MPASPACPSSPGFTPCCCRSWHSRYSVRPAIWWWPPNSATAAIFASSLSRMAAPASAQYMALVGMVALLTAGFLLLARIFKLGFLADFLSRTVLVGFLTGVGFQVGIAMLGDMFGVAVALARTLVQVWEVLQGLPQAQSSDAGAVDAGGGQHSARQSLCPALAAVAARGRRDDRGERRVPLRRSAASRSSVRSPADCRRSGCPT